jgi:hypothetical protein
MKTPLFLIFSFISFNLFGQHNLIGKTQDFILTKYQYDPEYTVKIDTINDNKILITCRTFEIYPYYTYEIDKLTNKCISYGFISRNREIFKSQIEMLDYLGKLIETDSSATNFVYELTLPEKKIYYTVRQPFVKSQIKTRRDLYYILVTEDRKKIKIHD